jgi:glycosyltransferase involved in cell wall biosynthesis
LTKLSSITVFFPVYNDAPTIEGLVRKSQTALAELTDDWEIVIIDDCSPDNAGEIADRLAAEDARIRVIHHATNRGYGGALKAGFAAARKDWVFYTDGDGQYDVLELRELAQHAENADIVNGYKLQRGDELYRKIIGEVYHYVVKTMFRLPIRDVDCDFRLIRKSLLERVTLESNSGVICAEMMTKFVGAGARIVEAPVHHYPRVAGKSQFFRLGRITQTLMGLMVQWWKLMMRGEKYSKHGDHREH